MLALLRRIVEGDRSLRRRDEWEWGPDFMVGEGLEGKTVLVVGPGGSARASGELVRAHGARTSFAGRGDDLGGLLAAADVVTLHCPLTPETRHLIDADALAAMKPTAVLVNTARGPVVDESALVDALRRRERRRRGSRRLRARARRSRRAPRAGERRPHAAHRERDE